MSSLPQKKRVRRKKGDPNPFFDNPTIPGKKYFLASLISPDTKRQKGDVHAFKIHDMCDEEDIPRLSKKYRDMDPDFDVFCNPVGIWMPWVTDPLHAKDVEYIDKQVTELLREKRNENEQVNTGFGKKVKDIMEENIQDSTDQKRLVSKSEPAVSVWYKMRQLEEVIKQRRNEMEALQEIFHNRYTKEERKEAKKADLPISKPAPMHFSTMAGLEDDSESESENSGEENEGDTDNDDNDDDDDDDNDVNDNE